MKPTVNPILGPHVRLRLLARRDLNLTMHWRNQDRVRHEFLDSDILTQEKYRAWARQYFDVVGARDFVFIIEALGVPVGQVSIYNVDYRQHWAQFGRMMIGEEAACGKGYALEATRLACSWAVESLGVKRFYLCVKPGNRRAIEIYKSVGFIHNRTGGGVSYMEKTVS